MANRRVLVTGGAGFIASHVAEAYLARGDQVWVLDNLSTGRASNLPKDATFVHASVNDERVAKLFDEVGGFDIVNHHAAQVDVRKSVSEPRQDLHTNLDGLLNLLENSVRTGVGKFIFVSSGGVVYGEPDVRPTPETAPKQPHSPYGVTKLASELYLHYYHTIHGLNYVAQRYANVYGPRQDPHGEAGVVAIFSNLLLKDEKLTVYGDGLQTRDYVFVYDVVAANMLLSDLDLGTTSDLDQRAFNVGTGVESNVLDVAKKLAAAAGSDPEIVHGEARAGELRRSCLDATKLRSHGWQAKHSIDEGLSITYNYIRDGEKGW